MRINLTVNQMAEIKRIVKKEFLINAFEPTDEYLFINCFERRQKETFYYHLFLENDTLIIRCFVRLFDNLSLSMSVRGTAKELFNYLVIKTGLKSTKYIENGVAWKL